jgi:DNA-3-methyladenine glycosylase II
MATAKKPDYWKKAQKHLSDADPVMAEIISSYKGEALASRGSAFFSLARAIIGQQISVKAAESVWNKLSMGLGGEVLPAAALAADEATLRACGLSRQKVLYLKELSQFFSTDKRHDWHLKSDEQIIADLISIKGIGKWSAEMFLIFHLMRPDIFPIGDLAVRKAVEKYYNKGKPMLLPKMQKLAERWKPYRTVASWYLWRTLDPMPVEY